MGSGKSGYGAKYAKVNLASTGDVVASVAGHRIRVVSLFVVAAGDVDVTLRSATTNISGDISLLANTGFVLGENEYGWCETEAGEAFNIELGGSVQVSGTVTYFLT